MVFTPRLLNPTYTRGTHVKCDQSSMTSTDPSSPRKPDTCPSISVSSKIHGHSHNFIFTITCCDVHGKWRGMFQPTCSKCIPINNQRSSLIECTKYTFLLINNSIINLRFESPSEERTVNYGRLRYSFSEKLPSS